MKLDTVYMGLRLKNPLVPAASPLSTWLDGMKTMEEAGAGAITMFSLFEEQIEHEMALVGKYLDFGSESYAEATRYLPEPESYHRGPDEYLGLIRDAKSAMDIPIIASLNGSSEGGWIDYAKQIESAGADALELNVYWVETSSTVSGAEVEKRYCDIAGAVSQAVDIPVAIKIGPYFSSMANMAVNLEGAGVRSLVLFNRFYQPDFDVDKRNVKASLSWSSGAEMRLPLHWTAILFGQVNLDLAVTTGVSTGLDVVKCLMAGANVATFASCLMGNGASHITTMLNQLTEWMVREEYESVEQLRGIMSYRRVLDPSAFERGNYMKELQSFRPDKALLR